MHCSVGVVPARRTSRKETTLSSAGFQADYSGAAPLVTPPEMVVVVSFVAQVLQLKDSQYLDENWLDLGEIF